MTSMQRLSLGLGVIHRTNPKYEVPRYTSKNEKLLNWLHVCQRFDPVGHVFMYSRWNPVHEWMGPTIPYCKDGI